MIVKELELRLMKMENILNPEKEGESLILSFRVPSTVPTSSALGVPLSALVSGKLARMTGEVK